MLRVGLIGLGEVSGVHVNAINASEYGELVAVHSCLPHYLLSQQRNCV